MHEIDGIRLKLRNWRLEDYMDLFEYASLSDIGPKAGWNPHKNIDESKKVIKRFIDSDEVYAIELKDNEKVIGSIGVHNRNLNRKYRNLKQREIAIVLNPKYWNNGYANESINMLIDYGFKVMKLDIIWMSHHLGNYQSEKMIKKCNFKYIFQKEVILERINNKKVKMLYYILENKYC